MKTKSISPPVTSPNSLGQFWMMMQSLAICVILLIACQPPAPIEPTVTPPPIITIGGEVHGYVSALLQIEKADLIRLPDIKVYLKDTSAHTAGPAAITDAHGEYVLPRQNIGSYQLCAEASNFAPICDPTPLTLTEEVFYPTTDLLIAPEPGTIRGTILLADGLPCYHENQTFNTSALTKVWLEDTGGTTVDRPVNANSQGQYVLPRVPGPGSYVLKAECLGSSVAKNVNLADGEQLGGFQAVDLTLPNHSPIIVSTVASAGGTAVRRASAGDTVMVTTTVVDLDGDTLHYRWTDGTPGFVSADALTVSWALPGVEATNLLLVEVTDDKGGFANTTMPLQTGPAVTLFSGTVLDDATSAPIAGAQVAVSGSTFTTGPTGGFALTVAESPRYVLNVTAPHYALLSRVFYSRANDVLLRLQQSRSTACEPTEGCDIVTETQKGTARIIIKANTLVDKDGNPATGPLTVDTAIYDLTRTNPIPGDYSATDSGGNDLTMESYGAMDVTISDVAGKHYTLAHGETAQLSMPVDPSVLAGGPPPPTIPIWEYDSDSGRWMEMSKGTYNASTQSYEADATGFSAFNADTVFSNVACIKFTRGTLTANSGPPTLPFILHVSIPAAAGTVNHNDFLVTEEVNGLFRLPENTDVTLEIHPASGPDAVLKTITVNSGAAIDPVFQGPPYNGFPPFDYSACHGFDPASTLPGRPVRLTLDLPTHTSQFLSRPGLGTDAQSLAYYQAIAGITVTVDPATHAVTGCSGSPKCNLNGFQTANGLSTNPSAPAAGEVVTYYYNNGDLGLGREMHCKNTGPKLACYVTNYGTGTPPIQDVFGAITDAINHNNPIATVAMEYDPAADSGSNRYGVQFYVYNHATGDQIDTRAQLDGEGLKYAPQICFACHGGDLDSSNKANGSAFREFDVFSFKYDRPVAEGGHDYTQSNQEQNFRILNEMVKGTNPNALNPNNPIVALIDSWYASCGGVGSTACSADPNYTIPGNWTGKETLYRGVVATDCRACHIAQASFLDWTSFTQLDNFLGAQGRPVCAGSHDMPHGQLPFQNFWLSTNPAAKALLADATQGVNLPACQ
jgi:hypothetical protein